jgi:hypothetical protein
MHRALTRISETFKSLILIQNKTHYFYFISLMKLNELCLNEHM